MTTDKIAVKLLAWIDDRMHTATRNTVEALQFMRSRLLDQPFDPPERWRDGRRARQEAVGGPSYNEAADLYREACEGLWNISPSMPGASRLQLIEKSAEAANTVAASVHWPLYKASLRTKDAVKPATDNLNRLTTATLELTLESETESETVSVSLRMSNILELLPQLTGDPPRPEHIQRALTQLDKLRLDSEIAECFESLGRHIEFYHPGGTQSPARWAAPNGFEAPVHCLDGNPGWREYSESVTALYAARDRFGDMRTLPPEHPYRKLRATMRDYPRDAEMEDIAGRPYLQLMHANLELLSTAALAAVEQDIQITQKPDERPRFIN